MRETKFTLAPALHRDALAFAARLEAVGEPLLAILGAQLGPRTETKEQRVESAGYFGFDVTTTTVRFGDVYQVWLERMFNGHLGGYEDDVRATATVGTRRVEIGCYLFCENQVKVLVVGCDDAPILRLLRNALAE